MCAAGCTGKWRLGANLGYCSPGITHLSFRNRLFAGPELTNSTILVASVLLVYEITPGFIDQLTPVGIYVVMRGISPEHYGRKRESVRDWWHKCCDPWKVWKFSAMSPHGYIDSTLDDDLSMNSMTGPWEVLCWEARSCRLWEPSSFLSCWCDLGCLVLDQLSV